MAAALAELRAKAERKTARVPNPVSWAEVLALVEAVEAARRVVENLNRLNDEYGADGYYFTDYDGLEDLLARFDFGGGG